MQKWYHSIYNTVEKYTGLFIKYHWDILNNRLDIWDSYMIFINFGRSFQLCWHSLRFTVKVLKWQATARPLHSKSLPSVSCRRKPMWQALGKSSPTVMLHQVLNPTWEIPVQILRGFRANLLWACRYDSFATNLRCTYSQTACNGNWIYYGLFRQNMCVHSVHIVFIMHLFPILFLCKVINHW